jgi:hypothetical protein
MSAAKNNHFVGVFGLDVRFLALALRLRSRQAGENKAGGGAP